MDRISQNARTLRKNMTKEERKLWFDFLRAYPVRFMRQRPIGNCIVDFYCAAARLAVELDGSQHYEDAGKAADLERDRALEALGVSVLRIPNSALTENFAGVCEEIDLEVRRRMPASRI